ncbi:HET-domain-containing protein, partial [Mytilinidion resinicola]
MKDPIWVPLYLCIFIASAVALYRQVAKRIPYRYTSIPQGNDTIRLLRLLPSKDATAAIKCQLFNYSLAPDIKSHRYEALSYVWGDENTTIPVFIDGYVLSVKANLHAALVHLRDRSFERILWVDALCINQENVNEKEQQIPFMARIYHQASRVVVWLGEAANSSSLALEKIRDAGGKKSEDSPNNDLIRQDSPNNDLIREAILALLQRPWFRRIWILQEVGVARHILIMCGATEIDGHAFCLGVDSLKDLYKARAGLQSLIRSVTYLIKGAIFRPSYGLDRASQEPLGQLIDTYHTHEATNRHDKVYALLGMTSDDINKAGLSPNYEVPWKELLRRLVKFLLSEEISVETQGDEDIAVIKSKGFFLGHVSRVSTSVLDDKQDVYVTFKNLSWLDVQRGLSETHLILQLSAILIKAGDIFCLLPGASKTTIVRPCKDYFAIVMIAATPPPTDLYTWKTVLARDFLLAWDWRN